MSFQAYPSGSSVNSNLVETLQIQKINSVLKIGVVYYGQCHFSFPLSWRCIFWHTLENDSKKLIRLQTTVEQLADENKEVIASEYELKAEIEALRSLLAGREAENRQLEESAAALGALKADNEDLTFNNMYS